MTWRVAIIQESQTTPVEGRTNAISESGVGIVCGQQLFPSQRCKLIFQIINNGQSLYLTVASQVVHSVLTSAGSQFHIGFKFTETSTSIMGQLNDYIQTLGREALDPA